MTQKTQLDYKVDSKKLKQIFKLAGRIVNIDLSLDKEGNSRGFAVVEYEHPVEAVQSISMFDRQMLFDRRMTVRLDRVPDKSEGVKLPEGLRGIGIGLGPNGEPLRDVARNLPSTQSPAINQNQNNLQSTVSALMSGGGGAVHSGGAALHSGGGLGSNLGSGNNLNNNHQNNHVNTSSLLGPVPQTQLQGLTSNLAALSNVVGLSNLTAGVSALSNPLLSSAAANLSSLGLGLGSNNNDMNNSQQTQQNSVYQQQSQGYNSGGGGYNIGGQSVNRSDYDNLQQQTTNSVRSYNTRPQDDYNLGGRSGGGVGSGIGGGGVGNSGNNGGNSNIGNTNFGASFGLGSSQQQQQQSIKSDTIVIKNVSVLKNYYKVYLVEIKIFVYFVL